MNGLRKAAIWIMGGLAAGLLASSCASIGTPSGGPRDEDPPRFIGSNPMQGALDFKGNKAVLTFDELINVKDAFSKVVVSPPGASTPRVSSLGRRVTIEFRDTLLPNTTYTVDFGDAIVDNNEGNRLENFIYTFSTGPVLDSLMVSGMVLGAEDLEPQQAMYVGLHTNLADSAFKKTRFDRIAKTDDYGRFVIGGLAPGEYRIYALEDRDGDLAWSSPEESMAFYDFTISPYVEQTVATDSIFDLLTGAVDSVVRRERSRYLPNNILLRSYNTGFKQQYITKYERVDSTRLNFIFNAHTDSMPTFEVVTEQGSIPLPSIGRLERALTNDTLTWWLTDPEIINTDTLRIAARYHRADSLYNMVPVNDTLRMISQKVKPKQSKAKEADRKKKKADVDSVPEMVKVPTIQLKQLTSKVEINTPYVFESPYPLESFDSTKLHLEFLKDTLWVDVGSLEMAKPLEVSVDSLNPRRFTVKYPWDYETSYKITVDSLAGRSVYGLMTETFSNEFKIRPELEYGSIDLSLHGLPDSIPVFVQLLDGSGNPLYSKVPEDMKVSFPFLLAGKYHLRLYTDSNGNGKYDPGNFEQGILPDVVYYYPETIELKQNWNQGLDWNVFSTPVDKMKPQGLLKNKPTTNRR